MSFLTRPTTHYKESYLQALREFQQEGRYTNYDLKRIEAEFDLYIQHIYAQEERDKTAPDRVPNADFWLIDNDEYIGRMSIRYKLNEHLLKIGGNIGYEIRPSKRRLGYGKEQLRLGLIQAKRDGLQRVLVTCDEDNIGSKKIIEHNGGQLENALEVEGSPRKLRYWIDLTPRKSRIHDARLPKAPSEETNDAIRGTGRIHDARLPKDSSEETTGPARRATIHDAHHATRTTVPWNIRPFTEKDQMQARALIIDGLGEHFGYIDETLNPDLNTITEHYIVPGHIFIVAEIATGIIGTGALVLQQEGEAEIVRVSVHPAYRRKGIATAIVQHLLDIARQKQVKRVFLKTTKGWQDAIGLYQSMGFTPQKYTATSVFMALDL